MAQQDDMVRGEEADLLAYISRNANGAYCRVTEFVESDSSGTDVTDTYGW